MTVHIDIAQTKLRRLRNKATIWMIFLITVFGGLLIVSAEQQRVALNELSRRPAIGYPFFRGVRTVFVTNFDIHEVYWFTDCPRMKEFVRERPVAVYGDHQNHCHDWRFLDSDPLASHVSRP